jgi:alpha-glucosidase
MWNDIDLYHALRDFTADPVSFPPEEMRQFTAELVSPYLYQRVLTDETH